MEPIDITHAIPPQLMGNSTNDCESIILPSTDEARLLFEKAMNRLLSVNNWRDFSGTATASFQLMSSKGQPVDRMASPATTSASMFPDRGMPKETGSIG